MSKRNHEVTEPHKLLDENGLLIEPGWSRSLIQKYDRNDIKMPKFRIKEWMLKLNILKKVLKDRLRGKK